MLRLILKDFYVMKAVLPGIGAMLILLIVINISKPSPVLSLVPILISFFLIANALALDDKYKMESLYCSLPLKRSIIVNSKYFSTAIIILAGIILSFLIGWFFPEPILTLKIAFYIFFFFSLFFSVLFPISYRFGLQLEMEPLKIAVVLFLVAFAIALPILLIKTRRNIGILLLSLFLVVFVFVSNRLSLYFYKKRDF